MRMFIWIWLLIGFCQMYYNSGYSSDCFFPCIALILWYFSGYVYITIHLVSNHYNRTNQVDGVMVSTSVVYRRLSPRLRQIKDYTISICCFSAKHATFRRKKRLTFSQWQKCVRVGRHVYPAQLFQWASKIIIQPWVLV
jgi:hypothetical protein